MNSYSNTTTEDKTHYVVHVRIEKVTRTVVKTSNLVASVETPNKQVEEVVNVVRKSSDLSRSIAFAKNTLDLVFEVADDE